MPEFLPFRGLRYLARTDLDRVAAPPYDVVDDDERAALEATDPYNSVRLILPRDDGDLDRYDAAAGLLATWRHAGVLGPDPGPAFYGYRMTFDAEDGTRRATSGVIGALGLPAPGEEPQTAGVLPHERTLPKARSDRLALLRATRVNLDPIWGLSLAEGLSDRLALVGPADSTAVDAEGARHELWRLDDPATVGAITAAVAAAPVVLADGHHRFETAANYRAERAAIGSDPGAASIMALVVELTEDQLCVRAIHRLVHGAPPDLRVRLASAFDVRVAGPNRPESVAALQRRMHVEGGLGLVDGAGLALLVPRLDVLGPALSQHPEELRAVDATSFEVGVRPALDAADLSYRNDAATVAALVDKGTADAAVLLRAVRIDQIRAASIARVRMPEKTTFFEPKPRTGMVFRSLDLDRVSRRPTPRPSGAAP